MWQLLLIGLIITGPADNVGLCEQDSESKPALDGKHEFIGSFI
jgi:hypothetical protein